MSLNSRAGAPRSPQVLSTAKDIAVPLPVPMAVAPLRYLNLSRYLDLAIL
jgi:hypothetical protein